MKSSILFLAFLLGPMLIPRNPSGLFSEIRFKGDQARAKTVYDGIEALTAEEVADAILYMAQVPEKVTIADLVILPTRQANAYVNNRINWNHKIFCILNLQFSNPKILTHEQNERQKIFVDSERSKRHFQISE